MTETKRTLAAILAADVAGYSRLMGADEQATVAALNACRQVFRDQIGQHSGRVVDTAGDSVLAVFASVVEAVQCALDVQADLAALNDGVDADRQMRFRIGVNLGDVIEQADGTIYGDGVNVAARLESLAEPGGVMISGSSFDQIEGKLDHHFTDAGSHQVKNIAKAVRAYRSGGAAPARPRVARWIAPRITLMRSFAVGAAIVLLVAVAGYWWQDHDDAGHAPEIAEPVGSPDGPLLSFSSGPKIAVLPFTNLGGDAEQDLFVDGLTEQVISVLGGYPDTDVVARNSSFQYKGQSVDIGTVGAALGAAYVVEGSVRRIAETVRVTVQLIKVNGASEVWSESYDRTVTPETIFAVQDDIAGTVTQVLAGRYGIVWQEELAEARRKPVADLTSYECVLLASEHFRVMMAETHLTARTCLEEVVVNEPTYARAWSSLAVVYVQEAFAAFNPTGADDQTLLDKALEAGEKAVALEPFDGFIRGAMAYVRFMRGDRDAFLAEADKVIANAQNSFHISGSLGTFLCYAGEWEKGLTILSQAMENDPFYPRTFHFAFFFDAYRKGDYEAALDEALKVEQPNYIWARAMLAAAYGQLGRVADAAPHVERILDLNPDFEATARADRWQWFRYQEDLLDHFMDGLRKAGLAISPVPSAPEA